MQNKNSCLRVTHKQKSSQCCPAHDVICRVCGYQPNGVADAISHVLEHQTKGDKLDVAC